jgi:hypothetical protein
MQVQQVTLTSLNDMGALDALQPMSPQLLLVFGAVAFFENPGLAQALTQRFPHAQWLGCSTAGEISGQGVLDGTCTVTAVKFADTRLVAAQANVEKMADSEFAGLSLGRSLAAEDLQAVLIFGPGVSLNGSALVKGVTAGLGRTVPITGGLAGDSGAFRKTWLLSREGVSDNTVVALGLYGARLRLGHGSFGGWVPFGPSRRVTRVEGNVLFELDGEPALTIYRRYLGEYAKELPGSGLLFPFAIETGAAEDAGLIRTILGIDEAQGSLTLAGEVAPGSLLKLMQASTDRLIEGAERAAELARAMHPDPAQLAILVSCVGRKLVMGSVVEAEVEAVAQVLGEHTVLTGFYSNGEISPMQAQGPCLLHNQTMTITTLSEAAV